MRDLGCNDWELKDCVKGPWLKGRGAEIHVQGKVIGECGEIDPYVSELFELNVPMSGAQIDIQALSEVIADPVH